MRGSRVKALYRAFEARSGRPPNGPRFTKVKVKGIFRQIVAIPSERRRIKRAFTEAK